MNDGLDYIRRQLRQPAPVEEQVEDADSFRDNQDIARQAEVDTRRILARRQAEQKANREEESLRQIVPLRGDQVAISRTRWIWRDRVPLGGLSLFAGKGDVSKSTLFACFCAWLTTGSMKGEFYLKPQTVLYVVNEDSINETVVPRMIANGADMSRVFFIRVKTPLGADALTLPRDADMLRAFIRETGAVATFVDPLSANITGRKNDQGDMRNTYQEVNRIAEETRTSIWGLAHTRKQGATDLLEALMGSSEQGNVARSVHGLVMDPEHDGARILSCEKLNLGQKHLLPSLRFTVKSVDVPCTDGTGDMTSMPRIEWLPETEETVSDILSDQVHGNSGVDECARWMLDYLIGQGGEAYSSDVANCPEARKYSASMLKRARQKARITAERTREVPSRTLWRHPDFGTPLIHVDGVS